MVRVLFLFLTRFHVNVARSNGNQQGAKIFPPKINSRFFFFQISKEIGKAWRESLTRAKRARASHARRACEARVFLASFPSLALCFQPCSRPFV